MNPLKSMDLYKGVILAALLLLPATGWWIYTNHKNLEIAQKAIVEATKANGYLEEIGKLQKQIEQVELNRSMATNATGQHNVYFERQIAISQEGGLDKSKFSIGPAKEVNSTIGKGQRVTDFVVKIDFNKVGGKEFSVSRDLLRAILMFCESGASRASGERQSQGQSIWKLRMLKIANESAQALLNAKKTPPPEIEDSWLIKNLEFARREPNKDSKK